MVKRKHNLAKKSQAAKRKYRQFCNEQCSHKEEPLKTQQEYATSIGANDDQNTGINVATANDEVSTLLQSWGLADLKAKFKANYIVMEALQYLNDEDITELIPKIGQRAIFRGKLKQWIQQKSSENNEVPLKKIKLESKYDDTLLEQVAMDDNPHLRIDPRTYGTLTKISPVALTKVFPNNNKNSSVKQNMQSKVQKFFIPPGSPTNSSNPCLSPTFGQSISPPPAPILSNPRTLTGTTSPSAPPVISNPRTLARTISTSPPPMLSNPRSYAFTPDTAVENNRRVPVKALDENFIHNAESGRRIAVKIFSNKNSSKTTTGNVRIIRAAKPLAAVPNVKVPIPMVQLPSQVITSPPSKQGQHFNPDLTPFVTSIIRVETNCEGSENGNLSPNNPRAKVNRTTILQKIKPEGNSMPVPAATNTNMSPIVNLDTEIVDRLQNWNNHNEPEPISIPEPDLKFDQSHEEDPESIEFLPNTNTPASPETESETESSKTKPAEELVSAKPIAVENLDIRQILMDTEDGRNVIEYYEANEYLKQEMKSEIIKVVAQHCFDAKEYLTPLSCKALAEEIIKIFPNERVEDYFEYVPPKPIKSPIYNKYRNIRRQFFKSNGMPMPTRKYSKPSKRKNTKPSAAAKNIEENSNNEDDETIIIS